VKVFLREQSGEALYRVSISIKGRIVMFRKLFLVVVALCFSATVALAGNFKLTSQTITSGATLTEEQVFDGFGCTGKNQSPALQWTHGPKGTKSYAVTVYDPDAH
jgi:phosphatidylethanolamine-binding protein (PEBP) family uncharacterized protein